MKVFNNIAPVGQGIATQKHSGLCCVGGAYWQENNILKSSLDLCFLWVKPKEGKKLYSVSLMVDGKKIETQKLTLMTD